MTRRLGFLDADLPTRYDEGMTRTIRRYGNRKLYDVTESRYVTLAFLGERLRAGDDLAVVAHPAGTDITNETLANIVLAEIHGSRLYDRGRLLELIKASTQVVAPPVTAPAARATDNTIGVGSAVNARNWARDRASGSVLSLGPSGAAHAQ